MRLRGTRRETALRRILAAALGAAGLPAALRAAKAHGALPRLQGHAVRPHRPRPDQDRLPPLRRDLPVQDIIVYPTPPYRSVPIRRLFVLLQRPRPFCAAPVFVIARPCKGRGNPFPFTATTLPSHSDTAAFCAFAAPPSLSLRGPERAAAIRSPLSRANRHGLFRKSLKGRKQILPKFPEKSGT